MASRADGGIDFQNGDIRRGTFDRDSNRVVAGDKGGNWRSRLFLLSYEGRGDELAIVGYFVAAGPAD
jgi:hypothetical protein